MSSKERLILVLLAALNFTHILDFMIMMPLGNYLMPYFSISPQQFSFLVSSYTISAAISGFAAAFFVDGFDRKKVLLTAYLGFLIGTLACGLAPTFTLLFLARTVAGIFGGLIGAQVLSIVADTFPYERRGMAMGALMSAFSIASTLGVPFALYLANLFSWHAPFLLVGGLGFVLIPFLLRYIPSMTSHIHTQPTHDAQLLDNDTNFNQKPDSKWATLTYVLKDSNQYKALIFSGLIMFGHFLIIPFINPFMEFNMGYSKSETPLVYLVGGIASFISANILGRLSDKYGKLTIFSICVMAALPMIYAITNMPHIHLAFILLLFAFWFAMATGRGVSAQAMVSQVVNPEHRGSFQSFNSSIQQLGTGVASLTAGYMVLKGEKGEILHYDWVGYLSITILIVSLLLGRQIFKNLDVKQNQAK
jgi:MFS transporter, DHA1 family, inner membrane transport protein